MPRKSVDATKRASIAKTSDKVQQKTERSHEENQERAYIAASRRADRSIEARIQSARMASDIHKKRTGKGFRITEEIVMKEEMYEEEEDAFPRSLRLLGPHMQTTSPELNLKMEAYLTNRMAMSALVAGNNDSWRQNEVHRRFAQFFPDASRQAQQLSQSMSQQIRQSSEAAPQSPSMQTPTSPNFQTVNYNPSPHHHHQHSFSMPSVDQRSASPSTALSPASHPRSPLFDNSAANFTPNMHSPSPMNPPMNDSIFTAELPGDAKLLMAGTNVDMSDPFNQSLYGQDWVHNSGPYYDFSGANALGDVKTENMDGIDMNLSMSDFYGNDSFEPLKTDTQDNINWGSFVNEDSWDMETQ